MQSEIDSRRIASAMIADEEVATTMPQQQQPSALDDGTTDPQQERQLVIQTRDLTLLTPQPLEDLSAGSTPLGSSPCLAPYAAQRGDLATPHHYPGQGESASIMADVPAVLGAQPTPSSATRNEGSVAAAKENAELFHEMSVAVDQTAVISLCRLNTSTLMTEVAYESWSSSGDEQTSPNNQAPKSVLISATSRHSPPLSLWSRGPSSLDGMPNEVLMHILSFLDVCDLLATSRTNHHFRALSLHPLLHMHRLRRARAVLPPLLTSPSRPTLPELISRHIFQTHTTQVSRRLGRSLAAIRLSRRLPQRPSAESLAQRGVLPLECVVGFVGGGGGSSPAGCSSTGGLGSGGQRTRRDRDGKGVVPLSPALVARKRAVERERLKDGLRRWVGAVWRGEVRERSEGIRRREESAGVGRVWRLRRFWERVGSEEAA